MNPCTEYSIGCQGYTPTYYVGKEVSQVNPILRKALLDIQYVKKGACIKRHC